MTKAELITAVEAKTVFRKWATQPALEETVGDIEKWHGVAYIDTPEGYTNTHNVWFMVDTATGEATWQNVDTLDSSQNASQKKMDTLRDYLKANFVAYFLDNAKIDLKNLWAEAEVLEASGTDLARKKVLIYKDGANPVTHKVIV